MTEQPRDLERPGDVGQAYARLWEMARRRPGFVAVQADDLILVLQAPVAHATTPEALRRALDAAHLARQSMWDSRPTEAMIRAAIVAALGVPEPVEPEPETAEQDALNLGAEVGT